MSKIAQSDYDKPLRCPGWSGSGWTHNKANWCDDPKLPEGTLRWRTKDYNAKWHWKIRKTNCCGTIVLPPVLVWINWRTWKPQRLGGGQYWWYPGQKLRELFR